MLDGPDWQPIWVLLGIEDCASRAGEFFGTPESSAVMTAVALAIWKREMGLRPLPWMCTSDSAAPAVATSRQLNCISGRCASHWANIPGRDFLWVDSKDVHPKPVPDGHPLPRLLSGLELIRAWIAWLRFPGAIRRKKWVPSGHVFCVVLVRLRDLYRDLPLYTIISVTGLILAMVLSRSSTRIRIGDPVG